MDEQQNAVPAHGFVFLSHSLRIATPATDEATQKGKKLRNSTLAFVDSLPLG